MKFPEFDSARIFPAIDIRGGRCVRLIKGARDAELQYDEDPVEVAQRWQDAGSECLHVIDLGAATPPEIAVSILAELVLIRRRSLIPGMGVETHAPPIGEAEEAAKTEATPRVSQLPEASDPVCGMTVEVGSAQHLSDHAGQVYYFCCSGCKRSFDREPSTYLVKR